MLIDEIDQGRPDACRAEHLRTAEVVGAVCHDLRAPVRHIQGFADILSAHLGDQLDDEAAGYLNHLTSAAASIGTQLAGLGRFVNAVRGDLDPAACDSNQALFEALTELSSTIESSTAEIMIADLPTLYCDHRSLVSIFTEVIENALKFCPGTPVIEIGTISEDQQLWITVRDDGPGMRPEDGRRAADLFRRFHPSLIPGTGIGLTIVRETLSRQAGAMEIITDEGLGTDVRFTLPTAQIAQTEG